MDLQLSRRADYAVRAVLFLGQAWGDGSYRKIREISGAMAIPVSYTPQVLGDTVRAGLVEARAGREGGYRLARPPSEITLLEVVEAAEGTLLPGRCTLRGTSCRPDDPCPVHPAWFDAAQALRSSLATATLGDALASGKDLTELAGPAKPGRDPVGTRRP